MKSTCKINSAGTKRWFNDYGKVHREDGPAIEFSNGDKYWVINGIYHREDGPAFEFICGDKSYYYHGLRIDVETDEEFIQYIKLKAFW